MCHTPQFEMFVLFFFVSDELKLISPDGFIDVNSLAISRATENRRNGIKGAEKPQYDESCRLCWRLEVVL